MNSDLNALLGFVNHYLYELRKQGAVDYSNVVRVDAERYARAIQDQLDALERVKSEQQAKGQEVDGDGGTH